MGVSVCQADTHRDVEDALADIFADLLKSTGGLCQGFPWYEHSKVISAQTKERAGEVGLTKHGAYFTQDVIAALVSLLVVDDLEVVDVEQGQHQRCTLLTNLRQ